MKYFNIIVMSFVLFIAAQTSQITQFQNGVTLTADQLNAEFSNIYSTINNLDNANLITASNIDPVKLDASIDGDAISRQADGSLDVAVDGSTVKIVADQLVISDLPGTAILNGGITTTQILDNTIIKSDLAVKLPQITATLGNVGLSNSTGAALLTFTAGQSGDLANNLINITTGGSPVIVSLISGTASTISYVECESSVAQFCELEVARGGVTVYKVQFFTQAGRYRLPPGSFSFIDTPVAGTYEYKIKYSNPSATALRILDTRLMVYEL